MPFGIRAIMKKFIYVCNETHYIIAFSKGSFTIQYKYEQIMNTTLIYSKLL